MKFELNNLSRNCSKETILNEIKRVDLILSKDLLTRQDYDQHGKITSGGITRRLGGWQKALSLAGLAHKYSGRKVSERMRSQKSRGLTDREILEELRFVAKKMGRDYITAEDIRAHSEMIGVSTVAYRFGSWVKGLEKAGLKIAPAYKRRFSESEYFENLLNVWTYHARQPFFREMDEVPSVISSGAYENRFGSWRKALEVFVDKMNKENSESNVKDVTSLVAKDPKEVIGEKLRKRSVLREEKHEIHLGLRYKVLSRDKFKCVRCGVSPATDHSCRLHIDHKIPFSKGGKTTLENLQTLCEDCNLGKGNRHLE